MKPAFGETWTPEYTVTMREDEKDKALMLLDRLIRSAGLSRREVDRRLGYTRGQTSLVLSGKIEVKLQHVLDLLAALDVESKAFFDALYADVGELPLTGPVGLVFKDRLRKAGAPARPKPPRPRREPAELPASVSRELARLIERLVDDGIDARLAEFAERRRAAAADGEESEE